MYCNLILAFLLLVKIKYINIVISRHTINFIYNLFGVSLTTGLKLCRKSLATYKTPNHAGPNHKSLSKTKDQRPTLISISNNADAVANVQHNGLLQHDHTQAFSRQEMPQQTPRAVCLIMQQYGSIDDSLLYPFKAN